MNQETETQKEPEHPEFEQQAAILRMIGADFNQEEIWEGEPPDRHPRPLPIFKNIKLPLTPAEWFALCSDDGEHYIGGCCGVTSHIQDSLNGWLRFQWINCRDFAETMIAWSEHDGGEAFKNLPSTEEIEARAARIVTNRDDVDPWEKLLVCWWSIQGHYHPEAPQYTAIGHGKKRTDLENAIYDIERLGLGLGWLTMFTEDTNQPDHQKDSNRFMYLARIYPPLKTVHDAMEQAARDLSYTGWGIYDSESGDICLNGRGLCIFDSKASANEMLSEWFRSEEEREHRSDHTPLKGRLHIRPIKITLKDGLVYTD